MPQAPSDVPVEVGLTLGLHFRSPYHIRASGAASGVVDGHLLVREGPVPRLVLPGSTLKGRLRDHARRLWNARPRGLPCTGQDGCLLCQIFGVSGSARGRLRFLDAVGERSAESEELERRTSVALDPVTRTAARGHLFTLEVSPPDVAFEADIEGRLPAGDAPAGLGLLAAAAAIMRTIGGGKSRGLGWVDVTVVRASCQGEALSASDLRAAFVRGVLGG